MGVTLSREVAGTTDSIVSQLVAARKVGLPQKRTGFSKIASKPVDFGEPTGVQDDWSFWWAFERLHRRLIGDPIALAAYLPARDSLEQSLWHGPAGDLCPGGL